jgi:subtilase family serine protease
MKQRVLFMMSIFIAGGVLLGMLGSSSAQAATRSRKVCATAAQIGYARCNAVILTDSSNVTPLTSGAPQGYGPSSFKTAYGVSGSATTHLGIVVAYDAPNIQADLATFSKTFGLPVLPSCTSAAQTACFEKLNQRGGTTYPAVNSSWSVETSMDVETAHGMCTSCRISLVEATSASISNLGAAADTAVAQGAKIVSNSYGGPESAAELGYDSHYHHAGVTMVASSGDSGYGTSYPAASPYVVAVGGTTLQLNNSRLISEVAWPGAGSGCSAYEAKPSWQHDRTCVQRSIADVAADADPSTGAAIYDSLPTSGRSGWFTVGGTSLAAPLVAGIIANSGLSSSQPAYLYNSGHTRDIVGGTNGSCSSYLCRAVSGYDGPTGLGVLNRL